MQFAIHLRLFATQLNLRGVAVIITVMYHTATFSF